MKRVVKYVSAVVISITCVLVPATLTGCGQKDETAKIIKANPPSEENKALKEQAVGRRRAEKEDAAKENAPAPETK